MLRFYSFLLLTLLTFSTIIVRAMERDYAELTMPDELGRTALHNALLSEEKEIIKALIAKGIDVDVPDNAGLTPLMYAADLNDIDTVKELLKTSIDINARDAFDETDLHKAAYLGHRAIVEILLECPGILTNIRNKLGYTASDLAAMQLSQNEHIIAYKYDTLAVHERAHAKESICMLLKKHTNYEAKKQLWLLMKEYNDCPLNDAQDHGEELYLGQFEVGPGGWYRGHDGFYHNKQSVLSYNGYLPHDDKGRI